jgi:hypothetical protein
MLRVPRGVLDLPEPRLAIGSVMDDKVGAGIVAAAGVAFAAGPRRISIANVSLSTL